MSPPKTLKMHSQIDFKLGILRKSSLVCFCFASNKSISILQIYYSGEDVNIVLAYLFLDPVQKA